MPGFRRRTALVKRLWRLRKCDLQDVEVAQDTDSCESVGITATGHNYLKQLSDEQLEILLAAIDCQGAESTDCVILPNEPVSLNTVGGHVHVSPHVLFCEIWRWPGLRGDGALLKPLPPCTSSSATTLCVNPFHWSRVCVPGKNCRESRVRT